METIFCTLDAKRLTLWDCEAGRRASGGGAPVRYALVSRGGAPRSGGGKVVELADYLPREASEPEEPEQVPQTPRRAHRAGRLALAADLAASAGVLLTAAAVAVQFFA